jgi:hypothetical protein
MTHRVEVYETDTAGNVDIVGAFYYCSDECAKSNPGYSGWNGACDAFTPVECSCGQRLTWYRWNFETHDQEVVLPTAADYWETY